MKGALNYLTPAHLPNLSWYHLSSDRRCGSCRGLLWISEIHQALAYSKRIHLLPLCLECSLSTSLHGCLFLSLSLISNIAYSKRPSLINISLVVYSLSSLKTFQQYLDISSTSHSGLVVYWSVYHLSPSLEYRYMRTRMPSVYNAVSLACLAGSSCSINSYYRMNETGRVESAWPGLSSLP